MNRKLKREIDTYWQAQIKLHDALVIPHMSDAKQHPTRAVAFETKNFGWILGPVGYDSTGYQTHGRKILLQY